MARGVAVPGLEELPDGPRRWLVVELHRLYRRAGKPSVRTVSEGIKNDDRLSGTFSPDTVSKVLRGFVVPSWPRLCALVTYFDATATIGRPPPLSKQLEQFHALWLEASDAQPPLALEQPAVAEAGPSAAELFSSPRRSPLETLRQLKAPTVPAALTSGADETSAAPDGVWPRLRPVQPLLPPAEPADEPLPTPITAAGSTATVQAGSITVGVVGLMRLHELEVLLLKARRARDDRAEEALCTALVNFLLQNSHQGVVADVSGVFDGLSEELELAARIFSRVPRKESWRLSGLRLPHLPWNGIDLRKCWLENAWLPLAQLQRADLTDAELNGTSLEGADLTRAILSGAQLDRAKLQGAKFMRATLVGTILTRSALARAQFDEADMGACEFDEADCSDAHFRDAQVPESSFRNAALPRVDFTGANLSDTDFSHSRLTDCTFVAAHLLGASFKEAELINCSLRGSTLSSETLDGAYWTDDQGRRQIGKDLSTAEALGSQASQVRWHTLRK